MLRKWREQSRACLRACGCSQRVCVLRPTRKGGVVRLNEINGTRGGGVYVAYSLLCVRATPRAAVGLGVAHGVSCT